MSADQAGSKTEDINPSAAVLALADLLASLPRALPLANDAASLRASFDLLRAAQVAVRDPALPLLPKPPAPTDLAPLPLVEMIASSHGAQRSPPHTPRTSGDAEMR